MFSWDVLLTWEASTWEHAALNSALCGPAFSDKFQHHMPLKKLYPWLYLLASFYQAHHPSMLEPVEFFFYPK